MEKEGIAVIDSGIGGISVLLKLVKNFPNERFVYFGDNDNAPYGNISKQNLFRIVMRNIDFVKRYNIKSIVLACNTLSVNLFNEIKEYSSLPIFAVFPPVEYCLMSGEKTLLLATERTAQNYTSMKNFDVLGLKDLATIIEKNALNLKDVDFSGYFNNVSILKRKTGYYNNVILGCTHYNYIKKQIFVHFRPQKLYDGTENLINRLSNFLKIKKLIVKSSDFNVLFVGKNANINKFIYYFGGQLL